MAKLSRQTKEIIKTVIVLIIVGILLTFYVIYPLNKAKTMFSRTDLDEFSLDSLPPNLIEDYIDTSYQVDSFRIESDGLTSLACLKLTPHSDTVYGTVILLHPDDGTRDDFKPLAKKFVELSYTVILYDQRATGLSSGKYHGFGVLEASDLQEVISTLEVRGMVTHPLYIVGFEMGGDAALITAREESRIGGIALVNPYLTTDRFLDKAQIKYDSFWFPFYNTTMFWWYEMRSGFAPEYQEIDNMQEVAGNTLLLADQSLKNHEAVTRLVELSDKNLLQVKDYNQDSYEQVIIDYIASLK